LTLCAIGALLLGTVYFAAVFLSNRSDLSALLLACLSFSVLLQSLAETIRLFVSYPYPLHILRLELILSLAAVSSLLLVAYVSHQYARKWRRHFVTITFVGVVACAWFIPGFDSKTTMLVLTAVLVSLAAAIVGMTKKHRGAAGAAIALACVIAVAIVDVQNFINQTYYVATVALLLVLFAQQVRALRRAQREQAQAELRSTRLELELLKKQIQPHFLMNTLTTLTELLESEPASAVAMVESLAEELRAISAVSGEATIPLQQELDLCRHHLKVMSFRKGAQFDLTTTDVDLATRVPPGVFHTLMENALTHNRYSTSTVFELEESTSSNGRKLFRLRTPMSERPAKKSASGTGHGYVRARLTEAFGKEWSFRSAADGDYWLDEIEIGAVA
jgi:Histidine kinase